jgi:2-succinyl-6-hydroxy-2,4-cyclohexadiene-1-carboxylate synthase
MRTRRVSLSTGIEAEVLEAGEGGRPFLLVHGFTGAKEDFVDWIDLLAALGWHAVAPDNRGHGVSSKPDDEASYTYSAFGEDTLALADALGWDRFVLLGHSMGGMIAQHVVLSAPERVAGLVLMDTGHGPVEGLDPSQVALGQEVVREGGLQVLADLQREREPILDSPAHQRMVATRPGYLEWGERRMVACAPAMFCAMAQQLLECDDRLERLASVSAPTLVIVGEQDLPFVGPSERMTKTIPNARLAVLPDAGHSPQFENPDAWWGALTTFLAEVSD